MPSLNWHPQTTCDYIEQSPPLAMWSEVQPEISKLDWRDGEGKGRRGGILLCNGLMSNDILTLYQDISNENL